MANEGFLDDLEGKWSSVRQTGQKCRNCQFTIIDRHCPIWQFVSIAMCVWRTQLWHVFHLRLNEILFNRRWATRRERHMARCADNYNWHLSSISRLAGRRLDFIIPQDWQSSCNACRLSLSVNLIVDRPWVWSLRVSHIAGLICAILWWTKVRLSISSTFWIAYACTAKTCTA